jgi:hypothetical protein
MRIVLLRRPSKRVNGGVYVPDYISLVTTASLQVLRDLLIHTCTIKAVSIAMALVGPRGAETRSDVNKAMWMSLQSSILAFSGIQLRYVPSSFRTLYARTGSRMLSGARGA